MVKRVIIVLAIIVESGNKLLRMHWAKRKKLKESYMWELRSIGPFSPEDKVKEHEKRKVHITSYRKKMLDYDNLVAGNKFLVDCLIGERLLYDDSPKYLDITYEQVLDIKNPRTEIVIDRQ